MAPSSECLRGLSRVYLIGLLATKRRCIWQLFPRAAKPCCCCPAWQYRSCHCCPVWQAVVVIIVGWAICLNLNKRRLLTVSSDNRCDSKVYMSQKSGYWKYEREHSALALKIISALIFILSAKNNFFYFVLVLQIIEVYRFTRERCCTFCRFLKLDNFGRTRGHSSKLKIKQFNTDLRRHFTEGTINLWNHLKTTWFFMIYWIRSKMILIRYGRIAVYEPILLARPQTCEFVIFLIPLVGLTYRVGQKVSCCIADCNFVNYAPI